MYLPRTLISHLYQRLARNHHPLSPPVLLFVALEPDALCACRILTALLKRDYIAHKIQPISGYADLTQAGQTMVAPMKIQNGGSGGTVVCLGVGGLVDMSSVLGLDAEGDGEDPSGGVEVWLIDARRPWNLGNVFGGNPRDMLGGVDGNARSRKPEVERGKLLPIYRPGQGGIIVYDDGDIDEELSAEREAYCALTEMAKAGIDDDYESDLSDGDSNIIESIETIKPTSKRKMPTDTNDSEASDSENQRPRQKRRRNSRDSSSPSPSLSSQDDPTGHRPNSGMPSFNQAPSTPSSPLQAEQTSQRALRRKFHHERRRHNKTLHKYYALGASYSEPISSILYSLAEALAREDNDLLWQAIVGVSSLELYGRSMTGIGISASLDFGGSAGWGGERGERTRQIFRDEVRRLNPPGPLETTKEHARGEASGIIPTTAQSPTDYSIRLSPEPRFFLIRHWSLYEAMLHSPYLGSRLHIWTDIGRKRLHKFLAKMGVSLTQCKQSYPHMDMDLKRGLRQRLLRYAPTYGLDGLVPPPPSAGRGREGWGFVKSWGWKGCYSAVDVGIIVGAILEVGKFGVSARDASRDLNGDAQQELSDEDGKLEGEDWIKRFWEAYDALDNIDTLKQALPIAQHVAKAILRTGTSLIEKRQVRHLRAFRMAIVKEGPDVVLFSHPSALTKLALWVAAAVAEQEREKEGAISNGGKGTPFVLAGLNEARGIYVVVGTGGGGGVIDFQARAKRKQKLEQKAKVREAKQSEKEKQRQEKRDAKKAKQGVDGEDGQQSDGIEEEEEEDGDEEDDDEEDGEDDDDNDEDDDDSQQSNGDNKNRFGNAFQQVIDETNARVRIDNFEHCVVEVKKEDLSGFLESLSMKTVVG